MEVNSKEEALSLLAAANNHGDLAVKLSSLRQLKDILSSSSSSSSSFAPEVFPFLVDLHSSHHPPLRILLLNVIQEVGLKMLEHSSILAPVLLALVKDDHPAVARQAIVTGAKFFCSILEELAHQFHHHGKVHRWAEDMWMHMIHFKDAVLSLVFEPISVGTRLLALKFMETCIVLFTPDAAEPDRLTAGCREEHKFNISWLASGHPVLDSAKLISEANRLSASLLDMLQSSSSIPGPLTISIVN